MLFSRCTSLNRHPPVPHRWDIYCWSFEFHFRRLPYQILTHQKRGIAAYTYQVLAGVCGIIDLVPLLMFSVLLTLAWAVFLWRLPARFHQPHTNKLQVTNKLHTVKSITFVYSFVCVCLCMHAGKLLCLSLYTGKHLKEYCLADQCFILLCCCFPPLPAMDQLSTWRTLLCHSTPHSPMTSRLWPPWPEQRWVENCQLPSPSSMAQVGRCVTASHRALL